MWSEIYRRMAAQYGDYSPAQKNANEWVCLMDSGDDGLRFPPLFLLLYSSTPLLTYVKEPKPVNTDKIHEQQQSYETVIR